jgi:anthranilate phosphoribosyltransferase
VLVNIGKGIYNEHEVTAFMTVYLMRSITIEELQGFRDALLELSVKVDLGEYETIDMSVRAAMEKIHSIFLRWPVLS